MIYDVIALSDILGYKSHEIVTLGYLKQDVKQCCDDKAKVLSLSSLIRDQNNENNELMTS